MQIYRYLEGYKVVIQSDSILTIARAKILLTKNVPCNARS